jgi:hypothetical protein
MHEQKFSGKCNMSLSLTSLDDAYTTSTPESPQEAPLVFQAQAHQTQVPQAPSLPDHQKKARMVGMRPEPTFEPTKPSKPVPSSESFTDKMWSRRRDMVKVTVLVLMVTAALATHSVFSEFLTEYLASAYLSPGWERVAKLCYPASVMATIWCLKVSHKSV